MLGAAVLASVYRPRLREIAMSCVEQCQQCGSFHEIMQLVRDSI